MNTNIINDKKNFYKSLFTLALPMTIQQLINSSLTILDTLMVGSLGDNAIAAVALAGLIFFVLAIFLFGINSGTAIFISQFWGKDDIENIRKTFGLSLVLSFALGLIFFTGSHIFPKFIMEIFSKDPNVIEMGSEFLKISSYAFILQAIITPITFLLRCSRKVNTVTIVSILAILINTLFNYLLIFGNFGFPKLGVRGSALATVVALIIEAAVLVATTYIKYPSLIGKINDMFNFSKDFVKEVTKKVISTFFMDVSWVLGICMYTFILSRSSTSYLAASNIASTIERFLFALYFGIGGASEVMVGNQIGAGEKTAAYDTAKKYVFLSITVGIVMGLVLHIIKGPILGLFSVSKEVSIYSSQILIICSLAAFIKAFNHIIYIGIFRAGADTTFSMIATLSATWLIAVPLSLIGSFIFHLDLKFIFLLILTEEIFNFVIGMYRFFSKKWIHNVVENL